MSIDILLDEMFSEFINGEIPLESLQKLKNVLKVEDIEFLIKKINSLKDPSEYCKNNYDNKSISGFFLFIDAITALIINLGSDGVNKLLQYENNCSGFLIWIIKYVKDKRFHSEILKKFENVFI